MDMRRPLGGGTRMLGVLALLLGVLAMHGLSLGHDPSSMRSEISLSSEMSMPSTTEMPMPAQGHLAHLGVVCVAVLTGGLSLMLLLLALRRRGQIELYALPRLTGISRRPARAAPPARPSLTTLCLSRT